MPLPSHVAESVRCLLQPDKLVSLDFGANSVTLRPNSVEGDAVHVSTAAAGGSSHVFQLRSPAAANSRYPPGSFSFRADGLPSSPVMLCNLGTSDNGERLEAYSPSPPPPPPHCGASFIWRNDRNWGGGSVAGGCRPLVGVVGRSVASGTAVVTRGGYSLSSLLHPRYTPFTSRGWSCATPARVILSRLCSSRATRC